jgi:hypothetical protein
LGIIDFTATDGSSFALRDKVSLAGLDYERVFGLLFGAGLFSILATECEFPLTFGGLP